MGGYNFEKKALALRLKMLANLSLEDLQKIREQPRLTSTYCLKTPAGGIAARVSDTCSSAECTAYYLNVTTEGDTTADLEEMTDDDGDPITIQVWNMATEEVGGSIYIQAVEIFGRLWANWEEC